MSVTQNNTHPNDEGFGNISDYLEVICRGSGTDIEDLAGLVPDVKVPLLIAYYHHTQDWDEKCALVEILRFNKHRYLPAMMLDFLRAPKTFHEDSAKEYILLAKAFALGFMGDEYFEYEYYFENVGLIRKHVAKVLESKKLGYYPVAKGTQTTSARTKDFIAQKRINKPVSKRVKNKVRPKRSKFLFGFFSLVVLIASSTGMLFIKDYVGIEAQRELLDRAGVRAIGTVYDKKKAYKSKQSMQGASFIERYFHNGEYLLYLRQYTNLEQGEISGNNRVQSEPQGDLQDDISSDDSEDVDKTIVVRVADHRTYAFTKEGDSILITYMPDNPSIYEVLDDNGEYPVRYGLFVGVFLFLLAGLSALCLFYTLRKGKTS